MTIRRSLGPVVLSAACLLGVSTVFGHHSFSVYYDPEVMVTVSGTVESFRFTNPHGILLLTVNDESGNAVTWTVETTAPVFMARRGWSQDTIKAGEEVTIEGWHSRDGSNLMRMRAAFRPDGSQIAGTIDANDN